MIKVWINIILPRNKTSTSSIVAIIDLNTMYQAHNTILLKKQIFSSYNINIYKVKLLEIGK